MFSEKVTYTYINDIFIGVKKFQYEFEHPKYFLTEPS